MLAPTPDTEELVQLAAAGDADARRDLLARHRDRLQRMVAVRLDPRVAARVDPSDVVQEALLEASQKLDDYLHHRRVPFYPWLRRLAWEHLLKVHEKHLHARRRSVTREERWNIGLPDPSADLLVERLVTTGSSPGARLVREELRHRVRQALAELADADREVLVLRYLEDLPNREIADILDVTEAAVKMRHRRALNRLARVLGDLGEPGDELRGGVS